MPTPSDTPLRWMLLTPALATGAIAWLRIEGEPDEIAHRLGLAAFPAGAAAVRVIPGVDTVVAVRWDDRSLDLMPHGGPAVIRALAGFLEARGLVEVATEDPCRLYPEATSPLEAWMLWTLARAASPLAIDLLLDQPRRWHTPSTGTTFAEADAARSRLLDRLVTPPLVVAIGPANIGKSTLVNALAGSRVAIVADEPGTTRDHVGVRVDLDGLVVNWVDSPGLRESGPVEEREAQERSLRLARAADLVIACADPVAACPAFDGPSVLRVGLRSDLGPAPAGTDLALSVRAGVGVGEFRRAVRERLVPQAALGHPGPWRFWPAAAWSGP